MLQDRTVGPKIIASTDAAALEAQLTDLVAPPAGPGAPIVKRAKVTLVIDELPNVADEG